MAVFGGRRSTGDRADGNLGDGTMDLARALNAMKRVASFPQFSICSPNFDEHRWGESGESASFARLAIWNQRLTSLPVTQDYR
ncbi:MAG: hypothetical protein R2729_20880 [Bryobacteraceae bacterium]